jgi:gliding motility-associated-like protein
LRDQLTEVFVAVENEFGCADSTAATISSFDIALLVPEDTLLCSNEELTLTANSFGTAEVFLWSDDPNFDTILNPQGDSTLTVAPGSIAFYYIGVENNGCFLFDTVAVSLLEAGTTVTDDLFVCAGDTVDLFVFNDFPGSILTHQWEPEELIIEGQGTAIIRAIVSEPTTFTVLSTTPEGCTVENQTTVFTSTLGELSVDAFADPENLTTGESSQLSVIPADEAYSYQWQPPDGLDNPFVPDPLASPEESTVYIVTVTDLDQNGICQKSDTVLVQVFDAFCGSPNIFVPNAFTPNNDGENDVVLVRGGGITDLKFSIYNRWGEEVFYTEEQSEGWDGTYKGDLAEPAVFVYYLEAVCDDGETYFEKGNITLIR